MELKSGRSYTPRIESQPTSGSIGDIHDGSSFAAPANHRRAPDEQHAAEALGAPAAAATRSASERPSCLIIERQHHNKLQAICLDFKIGADEGSGAAAEAGGFEGGRRNVRWGGGGMMCDGAEP